jgi:diaminopimelate decarboxylase
VDAATHPYISTGLSRHKFGIDIREAAAVYGRARRHTCLVADGVSCHIGSQILDPSPILEAVDKALELAAALRAQGHPIRHLDLGGGLGIAYNEREKTPAIPAYVESLRAKLRESGLAVTVEPGRSIVGAAGALIARVLYRKRNGSKEFVVVDAAMNDLIRPSLYGAYHEIMPVRRNRLPQIVADVVGPVCESGDFLARDRPMADVMPGDFLAVRDAGAYGFVLSSNYNSRPRAPEILVEGAAWRIVRARETHEDLVRGETL